MHSHSTALGAVADLTAGAVAFGSLAGYLPELASGLTIVYYAVRFCAWVWKRVR